MIARTSVRRKRPPESGAPVDTLPPKEQLDRFLDKYTPEIAAEARAVLAKVRRLVPGACELVYDNYNALVIGFCPSERASDGILSVALYPDHVSLCFLQGVGLPDPDRRLQGGGNLVRHIRLESPKTLDEPAVRSLIASALTRAKVPIDPSQRRRLVIRSISAKQRPRRPRA